MVKMIGDNMLAAASDEDELLNPGLPRLLDGVLDHRFVHHRQHFLGDSLGGGQEAGSHACHGKDGFADGSGGGHVFSRGWFRKTPVSWHGPAIIVQFQGFGRLGWAERVGSEYSASRWR